MRAIDPAGLEGGALYRLCTSLVVPRPIAWVSTISRDGRANLAPFSFFNLVSDAPATVMVSIGRRQGQEKDTLRNIGETGVFAVHGVDDRVLEAMNVTAGGYGPEIDEFTLAGLARRPALRIAAPLVAAAPTALECTCLERIPVPDTSFTLVLGRVVMVHVAERCLTEGGMAAVEALHPIGKLALNDYAALGPPFARKRPVIEPREAQRQEADPGEAASGAAGTG